VFAPRGNAGGKAPDGRTLYRHVEYRRRLEAERKAETAAMLAAGVVPGASISVLSDSVRIERVGLDEAPDDRGAPAPGHP
jgi:hypothetical protein